MEKLPNYGENGNFASKFNKPPFVQRLFHLSLRRRVVPFFERALENSFSLKICHSLCIFSLFLFFPPLKFRISLMFVEFERDVTFFPLNWAFFAPQWGWQLTRLKKGIDLSNHPYFFLRTINHPQVNLPLMRRQNIFFSSGRSGLSILELLKGWRQYLFFLKLLFDNSFSTFFGLQNILICKESQPL